MAGDPALVRLMAEGDWNVRVVEATLSPDALQDLSDQLGAIKKVAIGYDLRFTIRLELTGQGAPPDEVVARLNAVLAAVSERLQLG